jgi:type I restriction enzyme R subunit
MNQMSEDRLVQQTMADYLRDALGWESVYAFDRETLGPAGTLGRSSQREVYLTRYLRQALERLNPALPAAAYDTAIRHLTETSYQRQDLVLNRTRYQQFRDGVLVEYRTPEGQLDKARLRVFDFDTPANNHFLAVRELWMQGPTYRRRPDIVGFVNGVPLLLVELKNVNRPLRAAYDENIRDYKDTIPHLFDANAVVLLSNGDKARIGSMSGKFGHFHEWKRLHEEEVGAVDLETLLKGVCAKANFLDLFENFILFDDSAGKLVKIVARNHQYLGVNKAVEAVWRRYEQPAERAGQLGVFWHTQGSGKSYSMVLFAEKVRRKLAGNFTFLVVTDRTDLNNQIYKTFAGCGVVDNDANPCRPASGRELKTMFGQDKPYLFSLINLFNQPVTKEDPYTRRADVVVMSDEAHRSQYGRLAINMRLALPQAQYIGFTGTPLMKDDELTRRIFGEYVSTYNFQRAVEDGATVPLYYDSRGEKLQLNNTEVNTELAAAIERLEDDHDLSADQRRQLEKALARAYPILTATTRLEPIARDFVMHYSTAWESGKAIFVCLDKVTTVRMYALVQRYWAEREQALAWQIDKCDDDQELAQLQRQLAWMQQTRMAVVISEEQNEVATFRGWGIDVEPHRALLKQGFELADGKRVDVETAFKDDQHPFRVAFVCAMWLTGFDVPSLGTLYLDKPLKAHTLMQAIARANRVYQDKTNGLVVDYSGILKSLREALVTFGGGSPGEGEGPGGGTGEGPGGGDSPIKPDAELLDELAQSLATARQHLLTHGFELNEMLTATGFARNAAIIKAADLLNAKEETRKHYQALNRDAELKLKACLNVAGVHAYLTEYDALRIISKKLDEDREKADITALLRAMQDVVDGAVTAVAAPLTGYQKLYDMSKINFERLRQEFAKSEKKNTLTQQLKQEVEEQLHGMVAQNPARIDFNQRYQEIIADYNHEKERQTIEDTFEQLLNFYHGLSEEQKRAAREGLSEQELALYDQLHKPNLKPAEYEKLKQVAHELLAALQRVLGPHWRETEASKAEVRSVIKDFLWDEQKGLPDAYSLEEVEERSGRLFEFFYEQGGRMAA